MEYLTPSALIKVAPAAARLVIKTPGMLDTDAFLKFVGKEMGYRPVFAAQGTTHSDAKMTANRGRHLVVAADVAGNALALLNSHTVHRKAWMASGFVGNAGEGQTGFVVGAAVPLQRWRGVAPPLEILTSWQPSLLLARKALQTWKPTGPEVRAYAALFATEAYLPGHKAAHWEAFTDVDRGGSMYDIMFSMVARAVEGNLRPADPRGGQGRRVKPIKGPDALMRMANGAFRAAVLRLQATKRLSVPMVLPAYSKT